MQQIFENDTNATILIWVEPWALGYEIPPSQELLLSFGLSHDQPDVQVGLSFSKAGEACLTVWVSMNIEPTASIDGIAVEPAC